MPLKVLIVGQGFMGSHLALEGIRRGHQITVIDRDKGMTSSRISAGLLNPAPGRRFSLTRESLPQWKMALDCYRHWEKVWGIPLLEERYLWRLLQDEQEEYHLQKRVQDPLLQPHFETDRAPPSPLPSGWAERKAVRIRPVYVLAAVEFLDRTREEISRHGTLVDGWLHPQDLAPVDPNGECWNGPAGKSQTFDRVLLAEGAALAENPLGQDIPFFGSQGEIVHFQQAPVPAPPDAVLHSRFWYFHNSDGTAKLGSTADHEGRPATTGEKNQARAKMFDAYGIPHDLPPADVTSVRGSRPRLRDNQPILGPLPNRPHLHVANGTGGRGGTLAPWMAKIWWDHTEHNQPIPKTIHSLRRGAFAPQ